jgi:hypothetical protein
MLEKEEFLEEYSQIYDKEATDSRISEVWFSLKDSAAASKEYRAFKNLLPTFIDVLDEETSNMNQEMQYIYDNDERFPLENVRDGVSLFLRSLIEAPEEITRTFFTLAQDSNWNVFMKAIFQAYFI